MEQNKEIRQCSVEFHKVPESPVIEGRAIPFNVQSPNREGFREMITPEAVEGVLEKSDIFLLYNHDRSNGFLARNKRGKGSLSVDVREDGVYFAFAPGSDNLSLYIKDRIERGDLDEMSWAFTVAEDRWEKQADGVYDRTITKFDQIYDFSIVDQSYYGLENAVKCARFAEVLEEERLANEQRMAEEERLAQEQREAEEEVKRQEEEQRLKEYYENLRKEYLK
jgi:HK97 family phage prohead protease